MAKTFTMFSSTDDDKRLIVQRGVELAKMAMQKHFSDNFLSGKFSYDLKNYEEENKKVRDSIFKYCGEKAGLSGSELDFSVKENLVNAFNFDAFEKHYFSIEIQILNTVNADNEVEDILKLANISSVGLGDSKTFDIESKALYRVQEGSYGNNVSLYQRQFRDSITLTPSPKDISIDMDVIHMTAYNYDFGKHIAKVAMSFRTRMYKEIVDEIYTIANVSSTPFYEPAFAKTTYTQLATRVDGANGNVGVYAVGTRDAFINMSDNINNGYATLDEINKTGFIGNLYGVSSMLINQAVDSNTANFTFQVPNDRVLLISMVGDKPVKLVKEGSIWVVPEDGKTNSLYTKKYSYKDYWKVGLATQSAYGIQEV